MTSTIFIDKSKKLLNIKMESLIEGKVVLNKKLKLLDKISN